MNLKIQKVLITGIDSFTGKHLTSYLYEYGYEVYGTSLFKDGDKIYKCDITKKDDIKNVLSNVKPDFIIHLSGISFPAHGNMQDFYLVNTVGAINILDCLVELELSPKKIIVASSATIYGNQGVEVLDERLCPKPANHYGASKYSMECLASTYFNRLNIIIARPFNYTGVGQADCFLIPKIVKHFKENKKVIELGNLNVMREFNDISYICEIYKQFLQVESKSKIVNISSNRGIKLLDVIDMMNEISGYKIEVEVNPEFVRKGEIKSLTGSTKELFEVVGKIKQKDFIDTLREMYEA